MVQIINQAAYAALRKLEIDGASDRKMYSELFKYLPSNEIPKMMGGLSRVQREMNTFRFYDRGENCRSNTFSVIPMTREQADQLESQYISETGINIHSFEGAKKFREWRLHTVEGIVDTDPRYYSYIARY